MNKKNKKGNTWTVVSTAVWFVMLAVEILLGIQICLLDMLPTVYLLLVLALLALAVVVAGMLLLRRQGKWQKKSKHTAQVVGMILAAVVIAGSLLAYSVISQVRNTIHSVTEVPKVEALVDVFVRKDDAAQSIEDTADYTFAVTDFFDWENTQSALAEIKKLTGRDVKTVQYADVFAMVDALYANEVDAFIVNNAYVSLLSSLDPYEDFTDRTRVLYTYTVEKMVPVTTEPTKKPADTQKPGETTGTVPVETTEPSKKDPDAFVLYVSGYDSYGSRLYTSCSDVNILVAVNPNTKQILLVNTPRDYYIPNPKGNGALDKLTHCGLYGVDCSVEALEDFYNIDIRYYAQVNFSGFMAMIDAVGGIVVQSDVNFSVGGDHFYVGDNYLNGEQALRFARARKQFAGGDHVRGRNQMKVIKALINKLTTGTAIANYSKVLDSMKGMFATNMPQEKISELVKMQLSDMAKWNIQSYAVTGTNSSGRNFSLPSMDVYIMLPHEAEVEYARGLIDRVLEGEILTDADVKGK